MDASNPYYARIKHALTATCSLVALTAFMFILTLVMVRSQSINGHAMILWPGEGITVALMLGALRKRPYLGLAFAKIGSMAAGIYLHTSPAMVICVNLLYALQTFTMFKILKSQYGEDGFSNTLYLAKFLLAAAVLGFATSALQEFYVRQFFKFPLFNSIIGVTLANFVGYAVTTPLIDILRRKAQEIIDDKLYLAKSSGLLVTYTLTLLVMFSQTENPVIYLIPLELMLLAYISDVMVVAAAVAITIAVTIVCTLLDRGPFDIAHDDFHRSLYIQTFITVITVTALPIAALMAEHSRLKRSLIAARIEAEAASHAKSMFLATISHEVRTPLNGVLGMAQVLAMDNLTPLQHERVEVVKSSGETLLTLLNDVLDISKIEAGKLDIEQIEFDLGELLRSMLKSYSPIGEEKGLNVELDMGDAEGVYLGDPTRVRQIVSNLVSNALKFTEAGTVQISTALEPEGLRISVTDTGIGIPADKLHRLFEKFSQVDSSTTRRFGGTGLGLSICRELTEIMGGAISVHSEEGMGARFEARLPLPRVGDVMIQADPRQALDDWAEMGDADFKILAAEDNPTNQLVLRTLLQSIGLEVLIVCNGAEAVEAWEREDWDLVLMDVQMPVMDGVAATRAIRAKERELGRPRTRIVALTANAMAHQLDDYKAAGMDGFVAKPIQAVALFSALKEADPNDADQGHVVKNAAVG